MARRSGSLISPGLEFLPLGHGIDIRGGGANLGGYVVGPGSVHQTGVVYTPTDSAMTIQPVAAELVSAHGISEVPNDRGLNLITRMEDCPLQDGYVIPEPYIVAPDGIHLMKDDGAGYARVAWSWLFPVRVYIDPDGDQLVELTWRDGRRWVSRLIRRAITKSGRKLVAEAGDAGLPVIEAEAKQAERWLAAAEAANHGAIARHPVARQLGWQADGKTFVTGQATPWRVEPRYSDQAAALATHRPSGTLAAWKDAIAVARDHIIVQVGAYAGLASPLLHPLGLDSFTVDFSGRSTRGKSRYVAAAIAIRRQAKAERRTPEQAAELAAVLAGLPRLSRGEVEAGRSLASGFTRAQLAAWTVPWPRPAGWLQALLRGEDGSHAR